MQTSVATFILNSTFVTCASATRRINIISHFQCFIIHNVSWDLCFHLDPWAYIYTSQKVDAWSLRIGWILGSSIIIHILEQKMAIYHLQLDPPLHKSTKLWCHDRRTCHLSQVFIPPETWTRDFTQGTCWRLKAIPTNSLCPKKTAVFHLTTLSFRPWLAGHVPPANFADFLWKVDSWKKTSCFKVNHRLK